MKKERLLRQNNIKNWIIEDWKKVLLSDECDFFHSREAQQIRRDRKG